MSVFLPPTRQYFRVQAGPCFDALVDWREKRQAIDAQCFAFAESVGGTGFYAGHDENVGNATAIAAVIFDGTLPEGWRERRWKSFVREPGRTPGWPDSRTKAGRELLKHIKALPLRPSSNRVCAAIGFPLSISYAKAGECRGSSGLGFFDVMNIGWSGETFYVALPKLNEEIERYEARGYTVETPRWEPLEGMVPILKEEMELDYAKAAAKESGAIDADADEDLGLCDLCLKPLQVGQFVNLYDDIGTAHANCEAPFARPVQKTPAPGDDGTTMPTYVLLGQPAILFDVSEKAVAA